MGILRVAFRSGLLASLLAGSAALAACQGDGEPRDAAAGLMASGTPGYSLQYVDTGETAKLAYGQPDSELMSLMLECAKGSGDVEISDVAQGAGELTLASGGRSEKFDGAVSPAPMAPVLIADASANAPVLQAFRRTGRVEVQNGKLRYVIAAEAPERPALESFFAACEATA